MAIIKSKHANNYTVIPNEVFKLGLSIEAVGLITYLLSMPHDWVIYKTTLHNQFNMSRLKMDNAFKELQNFGYILSVRKHIEGRLEWEHIVYDKPFNGEIQHTSFNGVENNSIENNVIENNNIENVQLLNTNKQNKHKQSKEIQSKNIQIPAWIDFLEYATLKKPTVCENTLKLKYDSWVENNWVNGNGVKIKNWKSALLNTLPYIKDGSNSNNTKMVY